MTDTAPTNPRTRKEVDYSKIESTTISAEITEEGTMVFFFIWATADGYVYGNPDQTRTPNIWLQMDDLEHYTRSFTEVSKSGSGYALEARVTVTIPEVEYTEDEALARLKEDWGVDPWDTIKERYQRAVTLVEAAARAENVAYQANIAVRHFRKTLLEDAKKASRYTQRLAALRAELEAEVKVQFDSQYDDIGEELANADTLDLVDDRVHEVIMNAIKDNLPEAPAGFERAQRRFVQLNDLQEG